MAGLDKALPPLVARLIRQFGVPVTLTRVRSGEYDPDTGDVTRVAIDKHTVAVEEEFNFHAIASAQQNQDGVQIGDRKLHVPGADVPDDMQPGDRVRIQRTATLFEDWRIINIRHVRAGSASALCTLHVRRQ